VIVSLSPDARPSTCVALLAAAAAAGLESRPLPDGRGGDVLGVNSALPTNALQRPGVAAVQTTHKPYRLASREHRAPSVVRVGEVRIGAGRPVLMAGPCVVEERESLIEAARAVKSAGANMLRGGAYKPRTSPYAFRGLGEVGLGHLAAAREATGLPVVTEVLGPEQVDLVAAYADMFPIGARNMANFPLLRRVGKTDRPLLVKRGFSVTVDERLMSAEYVLASGNPNVVLCERGIRSFDATTRFTLDLSAVPLAKELTRLPVIEDPSPGTGKRSLVTRMALAGLGAGADGLIVEVHPTLTGPSATPARPSRRRNWRRSTAAGGPFTPR
jgi:3-deoxy-7-phosphoheptulonate synthase